MNQPIAERDFIQLIFEDHSAIDLTLQRLADQIHAYEEEDRLDEDALTDAINFLDIFVNQLHFGKETEIIFKHLNALDMPKTIQQELDALLQRKDSLEKDIKMIAALHQKYQKGSYILITDIIQRLKNLLAHYKDYVELEQDLYALIHKLIPIKYNRSIYLNVLLYTHEKVRQLFCFHTD